LENHLRKNYTTLSIDQTLTVDYLPPSSARDSSKETVTFQITHLVPAPACLCVNTDLEVDIQPVDEGLAREALERALKLKKPSEQIDAPLKPTNLSWTERDGRWVSHTEHRLSPPLPLNASETISLPSLPSPFLHYKVTVTPTLDIIRSDLLDKTSQ
jgi:hypothetical protein